MNTNRIITLISVLLLLAGFSSCRKRTVIPDRELADIFHDIFLANAYTASDINRFRLDSLNIYEPILKDHGYSIEDVQYTIGNFSKRKSARIGDVVEVAIARLEQESEFYKREVSILDTINNVAQRTFSHTIFADTLIRVGRLKDTARLKMDFDLMPGEYTLSLDYEIDSLDQNEKQGLRANVWVERHNKQRAFVYNISLMRGDREHFRRRFTADTTHKTLHFDFLHFSGKPKRPSVTIRNMKLEFKPPVEPAVDSLFEKQLNFRIFTDEFFAPFRPKTDSLPSRVDGE